MKTKRILVLAIALISSLTIYAQPGGGRMGGGMRGGRMGGQMGGQQGGGEKRPNENRGPIDFVKACGLFIIDAEPLIKKCKIKDKESIAKVNKLVGEYQKTFYDISAEKGPQIDSLNALKPGNIEISTPTQRPKMESLGIIMQSLREKSLPMHNTLKEGMKSTLSEKELKKWELYYKELCENNSFSEKLPQRGNRGEREGNNQSGARAGGEMRQRGMM